MKRFAPVCCGVLFLALATSAPAGDFEAALSSETAQFTFRSDSSLIGWGGADLGLGFFYNENDDFVFSGSLLQMRQPSEENRLTFGPGVKAYIASLDDVDDEVAALAIGGAVRYTFPGTLPMHIYGTVYFAPEITSFSGAEEVQEFEVGFQIEALPQTIVFVGIRQFEFDHDDDSSYEVDDDKVHFGVRLTF